MWWSNRPDRSPHRVGVKSGVASSHAILFVAVARHPFVDAHAERRDEAEIVQRRWTKVTCQSADASLDCGLLLQTRRPSRIARLRLVEPDPEDTPMLPHLVMKLSGDMTPFVLLWVDQLEQPLAPFFAPARSARQGLRAACVAVAQSCPLRHSTLELVPGV